MSNFTSRKRQSKEDLEEIVNNIDDGEFSNESS